MGVIMSKVIVVDDHSAEVKKLIEKIIATGTAVVFQGKDITDEFFIRNTGMSPVFGMPYGQEHKISDSELYRRSLREIHKPSDFTIHFHKSSGVESVTCTDLSKIEERLMGSLGAWGEKGFYPLGAEPDEYQLSKLAEVSEVIKPHKHHCKCKTCKGNRFTGLKKKGRKVW